MSEDKRIELKKGTRWEQFDMMELHTIVYGLGQIYDTSYTYPIDKLLKELNRIVFPDECKKFSTPRGRYTFEMEHKLKEDLQKTKEKERLPK